MKKSWHVLAFWAAVAAAFLVPLGAKAAVFYNATRCSYSDFAGTAIGCDSSGNWAVIGDGGTWVSWIGWDGNEQPTGTDFGTAVLHLPACTEGSGTIKAHLMTNLGEEVYGYNQSGWVPESDHGFVNEWPIDRSFGMCSTHRSADPIGQTVIIGGTLCESLLVEGAINIVIDPAAADLLLANHNTYWHGL